MADEDYKAWQKKTAAQAKKLVGIDILDEDDPYDMEDAMVEAFDEGLTPDEFILDTFADDINSKENDRQLAEEANEFDVGWDDD